MGRKTVSEMKSRIRSTLEGVLAAEILATSSSCCRLALCIRTGRRRTPEITTETPSQQRLCILIKVPGCGFLLERFTEFEEEGHRVGAEGSAFISFKTETVGGAFSTKRGSRKKGDETGSNKQTKRKKTCTFSGVHVL